MKMVCLILSLTVLSYGFYLLPTIASRILQRSSSTVDCGRTYRWFQWDRDRWSGRGGRHTFLRADKVDHHTRLSRVHTAVPCIRAYTDTCSHQLHRHTSREHTPRRHSRPGSLHTEPRWILHTITIRHNHISIAPTKQQRLKGTICNSTTA